ncbi:hypothetical protein JXA32_06355 [Candidatus Sumerlaeota bacterium]|nr:hypothetical protein [Candidatus Sumerlaeota bacterium]
MLLDIITDNPILTREMRRRMRGKAMIYSLIAYVGALCIVTLAILLVQAAGLWRFESRSAEMIKYTKSIGENIFNGMEIIQGILVLILAPAITASLITAERERQTADFLRVTTLPPSHYIVGSFLSTTLYVMLLLGCALPIVSVTLLFGGRSLSDVYLTFGALLLGSILLSSLGIYTSSINQRTRTAQGVMLAVAILFVVLFFFRQRIIWGIYSMFGASSTLFGQGALPVFGYMIPDWFFASLPPLFISLVTLVIAARKVYDFDNRPLNYSQYTLMSMTLLLTVVGVFWALPKMTTQALYTWWSLSLLIYFAGAIILNIHQVEVGTDNWKIHQRVPALAVLDDGILYFIALIVCTSGLGWWFFSTRGALALTQFKAMAFSLIPPFIFLAVFSRALSLKFYQRSVCFRIAFGAAASLWIVALLAIVLPMGLDTLVHTSLHLIAGISPFYALPMYAYVDIGKSSAGLLPPAINLADYPGQLASLFYLAAAALLYVWVARKNHVWKQELDAIEAAAYIPPEFENGELVRRG